MARWPMGRPSAGLDGDTAEVLPPPSISSPDAGCQPHRVPARVHVRLPPPVLTAKKARVRWNRTRAATCLCRRRRAMRGVPASLLRGRWAARGTSGRARSTSPATSSCSAGPSSSAR